MWEVGVLGMGMWDNFVETRIACYNLDLIIEAIQTSTVPHNISSEEVRKIVKCLCFSS